MAYAAESELEKRRKLLIQALMWNGTCGCSAKFLAKRLGGITENYVRVVIRFARTYLSVRGLAIVNEEGMYYIVPISETEEAA